MFFGVELYWSCFQNIGPHPPHKEYQIRIPLYRVDYAVSLFGAIHDRSSTEFLLLNLAPQISNDV